MVKTNCGDEIKMNRYRLNEIGSAIAPIVVIAIIIGIRCLVGFTDPVGAKRTLENQGYSNVEITGWRPFAASESDSCSTGFKANSPNGTIVTGAVTKGIFKGNTIRLD